LPWLLQRICWVRVSTFLWARCKGPEHVQDYLHIASGRSNVMSLQFAPRRTLWCQFCVCLWIPLFCTLWRSSLCWSVTCAQMMERLSSRTWWFRRRRLLFKDTDLRTTSSCRSYRLPSTWSSFASQSIENITVIPQL
jgi:hypothetical protein